MAPDQKQNREDVWGKYLVQESGAKSEKLERRKK
jgi:hypothetical protein